MALCGWHVVPQGVKARLHGKLYRESGMVIDMDDRPRIVTPPAESLMTVEDLAAWAQVSVRTVREWAAEGTGPRRIRLGRGVRYRVGDVLAWAATRYEDVA
jgi:predicted DNA-binding transcriptional regulator AlpA